MHNYINFKKKRQTTGQSTIDPLGYQMGIHSWSWKSLVEKHIPNLETINFRFQPLNFGVRAYGSYESYGTKTIV